VIGVVLQATLLKTVTDVDDDDNINRITTHGVSNPMNVSRVGIYLYYYIVKYIKYNHHHYYIEDKHSIEMNGRGNESSPLIANLIEDNRILKESLRVVTQDISQLKHDHTDTERLLKEEMLSLKKEIDLLKNRQ